MRGLFRAIPPGQPILILRVCSKLTRWDAGSCYFYLTPSDARNNLHGERLVPSTVIGGVPPGWGRLSQNFDGDGGQFQNGYQTGYFDASESVKQTQLHDLNI